MRRLVAVGLVLGVAVWHGLGLWQKWRPLNGAAASERLQVGALDRVERQRCLAALRDAKVNDPRGRVLALAAALALDDRAAFARALATAGPERVLFTGIGAPWPGDEPSARALVAEAALGDHWLRHLLFGHWLRAGADPRAAAECSAALVAARWNDATLGGELAAAAVAALPAAQR